MFNPAELTQHYPSMTTAQRRDLRGKYAFAQDNKCAYCSDPLSGPPHEDVAKLSINTKLFPVGFFKNPVHLHHHHTTGLTLGAVHARCNAALWQYHGE